MDLQLKDQRFIVCGASSGFGRAVAMQLLEEGAHTILAARRLKPMEELADSYPGHVELVSGDLTDSETLDSLVTLGVSKQLHGIFLNAGGPPASAAVETETKAWDDAYQQVFRWKIELVNRLLTHFRDHGYGRILFLESQSVKQPIPNLVLSNGMRAAIAGYAKTLAGEIGNEGITVNLLAPGAHQTPAINRVIEKRAQLEETSFPEARAAMEKQIPTGRMGKPEEIASLAAWLFSRHSGYVTGQVISHAGGNVSSLFG